MSKWCDFHPSKLFSNSSALINCDLSFIVGVGRLVLDHSLARNQRYLGRREHVLVEGLNPKQKGQVKISVTSPSSAICYCFAHMCVIFCVVPNLEMWYGNVQVA